MCKQNEETKFVPGNLNQTPWHEYLKCRSHVLFTCLIMLVGGQGEPAQGKGVTEIR